MSLPNVVVIRLNTDDELLAILVEETDNKITVNHPYIVRYDRRSNSVDMVPYCTLSDVQEYSFSKSSFQFLVPASTQVSIKFCNAIKKKTTAISSQVTIKPAHMFFVPGNSIQH
jgi:hypothetical protein